MNNQKLSKKTINQTVTNNENQCSIIAIQKKSGEIIGYKLLTGEVISKKEALEKTKNGAIKCIGPGINKVN